MGDWQDKTNYAWILAQFGFGAMTMLGLLEMCIRDRCSTPILTTIGKVA